MTLVNGTTIGDAIANAVNALNPMSAPNLATLKTYWEPMATAIMAAGAGGFTSYNIVTVNCRHGVQASVAHGMPSAPTLAIVLGADGGQSVRGTPVLADLGSGNLGVTLHYDLGSTIFTDWVAYTPTGTWNTNTTYSGFWRRIGDTLEVQFRLALAGAPNAVALGSISIPGGLTIDTSKINDALGNHNTFGHATGVSAGQGSYQMNIGYGDTSSVIPLAIQVDTVHAVNYIWDERVTQAAPGTFASGDYINGYFRVPIVGWSANTSSQTANVTLMLLKQ